MWERVSLYFEQYKMNVMEWVYIMKKWLYFDRGFLLGLDALKILNNLLSVKGIII